RGSRKTLVSDGDISRARGHDAVGDRRIARYRKRRGSGVRRPRGAAALRVEPNRLAERMTDTTSVPSKWGVRALARSVAIVWAFARFGLPLALDMLRLWLASRGWLRPPREAEETR